MDKEDVVHIHYGVLCLHQKDEYPTFVATWTGLEEMMLSEISQAVFELYIFSYSLGDVYFPPCTQPVYALG